MMFHLNLHHITLILNGYLSNISCSPLPFGLLSSQVSGKGIIFSHVELPSCGDKWEKEGESGGQPKMMQIDCINEDGRAVHLELATDRIRWIPANPKT